MQSDFPKTRTALAAIKAAFPYRSGLPDGVHALFKMMAQLNFEDVPAWSETLSQKHLDLLCDYFNQTNNTRVLLVITLVLWCRQDQRMSQVLQAFFHEIPNAEDRAYLASRWPDIRKLNPSIPRWIKMYLDNDCKQEPVAFLADLLRQKGISHQEMDRDFPETSKLFHRLTDTLFQEGGDLCEAISSRRAHLAAMRYLKGSQDYMLIAYLTHYPHERWIPELMDALRETKGPPDPEQYSFWQGLERPRLWGIRAFMFTEQMKAQNYDSEKADFWRKWLHKTQAWYFKPGRVRILAKPLLIEETPEKTSISMAQTPHQVIVEIAFDWRWSGQMEACLSEHMGWDQQF